MTTTCGMDPVVRERTLAPSLPLKLPRYDQDGQRISLPTQSSGGASPLDHCVVRTVEDAWLTIQARPGAEPREYLMKVGVVGITTNGADDPCQWSLLYRYDTGGHRTRIRSLPLRDVRDYEPA